MKTLKYIFVTLIGLILGTGMTVYGATLVSPGGIYAGLGTSTPFAFLQVASSTVSTTFRPQFVLTDMAAGVNLKHWYASSDKGTFNIGTTSDAYATSSPRIRITKDGLVGISTSTPGTALDINGDVTIEAAIPRVNTGANTAIACYTTGGQLGYITITNLLGVTPACSAL